MVVENVCVFVTGKIWRGSGPPWLPFPTPLTVAAIDCAAAPPMHSSCPTKIDQSPLDGGIAKSCGDHKSAAQEITSVRGGGATTAIISSESEKVVKVECPQKQKLKQVSTLTHPKVDIFMHQNDCVLVP